MSLVEHAKRELKLLGEDEETTEGLLKVIQAFADMGHSGGSAAACIPVINDLLQFKPLTPLTNDPDEWMHVAGAFWPDKDEVWQSRRNPEAFSNDSGLTYYLLSERDETLETTPIHTSSEKKYSEDDAHPR
jgi:hypothetical protein